MENMLISSCVHIGNDLMESPQSAQQRLVRANRCVISSHRTLTYQNCVSASIFGASRLNRRTSLGSTDWLFPRRRRNAVSFMLALTQRCYPHLTVVNVSPHWKSQPTILLLTYAFPKDAPVNPRRKRLK